tara:strand:- start:34 stop:207 length:174 start_codon:yes stop_codon:yes gene_type:complete
MFEDLAVKKFIKGAGSGQLTLVKENSWTNQVPILFYAQDEYLGIEDIANKILIHENK